MNITNKVRPLIREAYLSLTKQKQTLNIPISDLIKTAGISRAAFYRNYKSVFDVIDDIHSMASKGESGSANRSQAGLISGFYSKALIISEINSLNINKESLVVLSNQTMRDSDKATIKEGTPSKELMFRAGLSIYEAIDWKGKICIVAGKGNNAGDGFVLASLLKENKHDVNLLCVTEERSPDGDYYYQIAKNKKVKIKQIDENVTFVEYDIIVDAIFGTGFKGEAKEPYKTIINKINDSHKYVVSIDINSGLNGDNGNADTAVKSDITLSIGSLKSGLYLNQAKDYIKEIKNLDIGIKPIKEDYLLLGTKDVKKCLAPRKNFSNKGTYGYVALIGGSKSYSGAIRLSNLAYSSIRSGSGVTTLCVPQSISDHLIKHTLESTIFPLHDRGGELEFNQEDLDKIMVRNRSIAIGMGLGNGESIQKTIKYLLERYEGTLIIDADGINALAKLDKSYLRGTKAKVILTPHMKEFERLSGSKVSDTADNPIYLAKQFAKENHCILLLKGPTTIITDGINVYLTNRGCSGMATGGSGDVLSGIIASVASSNQNDLLLATASSAFINGLAGELAMLESNDISMSAKDTIDNIPKAINLIRNI